MSKMIIVRGLPGSGKSSLAYTLWCRFENAYLNYRGKKAVILSTDEVVTASDVYLWSPRTIAASHKMNQEKCRTACERGLNVIVDNTNITLKEMQPYIDIAEEFNYEFKIKEPDTWWRYNIEECHRRNGHDVPLEVVQNMSHRWQHTDKIMEKVNVGQS